MAVTPAEAKLRADVARETPRCRHHARFDFHFLRFAVQLREQAIDDRNHLRNVVHDDGVGAFVCDYISAHREEFLQGEDYVLRVSVAKKTRDGNFLHSQRFGFHLGAPSIRFLLERVDRSDAQNIAFQFARQIVVLEYDVQSLVPRHVIENHGQSSMHVRIEHHVQAADFVNQAEEILQIHVFKIY